MDSIVRLILLCDHGTVISLPFTPGSHVQLGNLQASSCDRKGGMAGRDARTAMHDDVVWFAAGKNGQIFRSKQFRRQEKSVLVKFVEKGTLIAPGICPAIKSIGSLSPT